MERHRCFVQKAFLYSPILVVPGALIVICYLQLQTLGANYALNNALANIKEGRSKSQHHLITIGLEIQVSQFPRLRWDNYFPL